MAFAVFHTDRGFALGARVIFDTYRDVVDYIQTVFLPTCRDGMAHVFDGDTMMMTVRVADGQPTYHRPVDRFIVW